MAGPAAVVHVTEAAVKATPAPWVLTSPQSTVRSYLDWTSYAYRIGQSSMASVTASANEEVRVDSYNQYNIEQKRLIDQKLVALTLGTPSTGSTSTLVPAHEQWTYSYLSTAEGNKLLGGPYSASYDSTYTVIEQKKGDWVVDSVHATPRGPVK
jgi:hypothetical protein